MLNAHCSLTFDAITTTLNAFHHGLRIVPASSLIVQSLSSVCFCIRIQDYLVAFYRYFSIINHLFIIRDGNKNPITSAYIYITSYSIRLNAQRPTNSSNYEQQNKPLDISPIIFFFLRCPPSHQLSLCARIIRREKKKKRIWLSGEATGAQNTIKRTKRVGQQRVNIDPFFYLSHPHVFFHPRFFSSPDECYYSNCTAGASKHATQISCHFQLLFSRSWTNYKKHERGMKM